nr:serine/threonine-protein kinase-like protein ccr4 [Quercus suber]
MNGHTVEKNSSSASTSFTFTQEQCQLFLAMLGTQIQSSNFAFTNNETHMTNNVIQLAAHSTSMAEFVANNSELGSPTISEKRILPLVEYSFSPSATLESVSSVLSGTNPIPANISDTDANGARSLSISLLFPPAMSEIETDDSCSESNEAPHAVAQFSNSIEKYFPPDREKFPLKMLLEATNNFSKDCKIKTNGFGSLYRAILDDGREVAIHRAENSMSKRIVNEFLRELEALSQLDHKNVVRLLGFCEDIPPIMHRIIAPSKILLDATLTAKLSNFNISVTSDIHYEPIAGTPGYLDPEYLISGNLTTEVDVYSFGVVLLEMLSGLKAIHTTENGELRLIVDFVVPYIAKKEIHRFLDPKVPPPTPLEMEALAFVVSLALDCVSKERVLRPSMTKVANRLQSALEGILEGQGNCWVQKELDG